MTFKAYECFSSTFQGKFNFQGLFKTVLYIQVLFKPVRTLWLYIGKGESIDVFSVSEQQRRRPACASVQSDQQLYY